MKNCGNCLKGKRACRNGVYCRLFGIMINEKHEGCKYYKEKDEGNGTTTGDRNELDASAAQAAG